MTEAGEAELVNAVVAGDEQAFRTLYRQHTPAMYGVARRLLLPHLSDAEDAVQEAWLRAVRGLSAFRRDSSLRTWLVGIAIRCALEASRHRRPTDVLDDSHVPANTPSLVTQLDLEAAIASLADGYRHVLVLHDVVGYTHLEIGELLGIEEGTSKSQLSRAPKHLRGLLSGSPEELPT